MRGVLTNPLCAAAVIAGIAVVAHAVKAETTHIPFRAAAGDRFELRISKTFRDVENGKVAGDGTITFHYDGEVVRASESGYRFRWTMSHLTMPGSATDNEALQQSPAAALKGVALEFDADPNGVPERLIGFDDILPKILKSSRDALTENGNPPDDAVMRRVEATWRAMTPAEAVQQLLPEAAVLGFTQGVSLEPNKKERSVMQAPSPTGRGSIKANSERELASYDTRRGWAVITWTSALDPDAARRAFEETVTGPDGQPVSGDQDLLAASRLERTDEGRALVSITDGWTRKLALNRKIVSGVSNQHIEKTERWLIEIDRQPQSSN